MFSFGKKKQYKKSEKDTDCHIWLHSFCCCEKHLPESKLLIVSKCTGWFHLYLCWSHCSLRRPSTLYSNAMWPQVQKRWWRWWTFKKFLYSHVFPLHKENKSRYIIYLLIGNSTKIDLTFHASWFVYNMQYCVVHFYHLWMW